MCLTCGCEQAHLEMGDNITYEDLKRIADGNGKPVAETLDIIGRTVEIDRGTHKQEYAETPPASRREREPAAPIAPGSATRSSGP